MALWPSSVSFQIQYEITRVRQKMKDLALLHDKHMNRPTLDDSSEEEHAIEITTQEITQVQWFTKKAHSRLFSIGKAVWTSTLLLIILSDSTNSQKSVSILSARVISTPGSFSYHSLVWCSLQMFHRCQRAVTGLQSRCGHCTEQEERLLRNVVSSLAQSLQELSTNFRHTQSSYLKRKSCYILCRCCFWPLCLFIKVIHHIILLCVLYVYSRHEESWGEVETFFWLWAPNGRGWRFGRIWQGSGCYKVTYLTLLMSKPIKLVLNWLLPFCFRVSQMTSSCWWSRTQLWLKSEKGRSDK